MSLCLVLKTAEGIVLAGDSRATYPNNRIGTDYATKVFKINKNFGLTTVGAGALVYDGHVRILSVLIEKFLEENEGIENISCIKEVSQRLKDFFNPIVDSTIEANIQNIKNQLETQKVKIEIEENHSNLRIKKVLTLNPYTQKYEKFRDIAGNLTIQIAGYNDKKQFQLNELNFLLKSELLSLGKEIPDYGIAWSGQSEYVQRIILGYDHNLFSTPSVKKLFPKEENKQQLSQELKLMEANLKYDLMPLQDGIDLVKILIETTSTIQRFADGTLLRSSVHGVGGAVDIAVITEKDGFKWIVNKNHL